MQGIIILDGPDCCGKTTLQNFLVKEYNALSMHLTYPAPAPMNMLEYQTREMIYAIVQSSLGNLVVVDRHWISEQIYAKVFRGGSPWPMMGRLMHRVWMRYSAVTVLCVPLNLSEIVDRHSKEKDPKHPYDDENFKELCFQYQMFAAGKEGNPFFMRYRIEYEGRYMDFFARRVIGRVLDLQMQQYDADPKDFNLAGHRSEAHTLMVGEALNPKEFHRQYMCYYPFFEHANSSLYLAEVLDQINIPEEQLMWTNANDPRHIKPLYEDGLKIVTLGSKAGAVVTDLAIPQYNVDHPQYVLRFGGAGDYMKHLKEAITRWR